MRGSALAALAAGVAACSTTPAYPPGTGQPAATPVRPGYPTATPPQAAAAPPAATPAPTPEPAPQTSAPVQSQPLAPVTAPSAAETAPQPAPRPNPSYAEPASRPQPAPGPAIRPVPARYAAGGKVISPHGMFRDYVVQRHDHLYAIARDLQTTPDAIMDANHLDSPNHLVPGQHLRIPVDKAYVAQSGDTLAVVAERFSVGAAELADLNDLSERARLRPGDQIALPASFHDRGPVQIKAARYASITPITPPARTYASAADDVTPRGGVYSSGATPAYRAPTSPIYVPPSAAETAGPPLSDTQIAALAHSRFIWPVHGQVINGFGSKGLGVRNDGIDVRSPEGSTVHAAAPGDVVYAGNQIPGYGNLVLIQHADGWVTAYAHLSRMSVQMRQHVDQGQEIGLVGTSGGVGEPQLHFEVRYKASAGETARPVDPMLVLAGPATG